MKKKISFLVILTIVLLATQVSADTISQIGKKVSGESSVYLNGNKIQSAIIVDNSSFAPVRAIAEVLAVDLSFEKTKEGNVIKMSTPELTREETNALIRARAELEAKIISANNEIERLTNSIAFLEKDIIEMNLPQITEMNEKAIAKNKDEIIKLQQDLITYTNELLELESSK